MNIFLCCNYILVVGLFYNWEFVSLYSLHLSGSSLTPLFTLGTTNLLSVSISPFSFHFSYVIDLDSICVFLCVTYFTKQNTLYIHVVTNGCWYWSEPQYNGMIWKLFKVLRGSCITSFFLISIKLFTTIFSHLFSFSNISSLDIP